METELTLLLLPLCINIYTHLTVRKRTLVPQEKNNRATCLVLLPQIYKILRISFKVLTPCKIALLDLTSGGKHKMHIEIMCYRTAHLKPINLTHQCHPNKFEFQK